VSIETRTMDSITTYVPAFVFSLLGLSFLLIIGAGWWLYRDFALVDTRHSRPQPRR